MQSVKLIDHFLMLLEWISEATSHSCDLNCSSSSLLPTATETACKTEGYDDSKQLRKSK